jgi:hypothetical protein
MFCKVKRLTSNLFEQAIERYKLIDNSLIKEFFTTEEEERLRYTEKREH